MTSLSAIAAVWLAACAILAAGYCKLLLRRPRYDRPSNRKTDGLRRSPKISPVHGAQYDR